ncbi:MAG TPA: cytochrome c [Candidatus Acidoferrum sp.]
MKFKFLFTVPVLAGLCAASVSGQQPSDFFRQNCISCHTIGGGRLTGPDLKDVTKQKDRAWLEHFIQNPKAVIDSGDPFALQLQQDARGVVMPTIPGMNPQTAKALIDFIDAESLVTKSRFGGVSISDRPFTPNDVAKGMALFTGNQKLGQGGPPCISCHTLGTVGGLGGGRLGPDLTRVYERLGGRKAVGTWLSAPGTQTMQSVFRQHPLQSEEILPLLSVFEDASKRSQPVDTTSEINFFVTGFAGTGLGLLLMGWIWQSRLRSIRRSLVSAAQRGGE